VIGAEVSVASHTKVSLVQVPRAARQSGDAPSERINLHPVHKPPDAERAASCCRHGREQELRGGAARKPVRRQASIAGGESVLVRVAPAAEAVIAHPVSQRFTDGVREKDKTERLVLERRVSSRLVRRLRASEPEAVKRGDGPPVDLEKP
jgi:hypothetical protein